MTAAPTAVTSTTAAGVTATPAEAGASARGVAAGLAAMVIAAEAAGAGARLAVGLWLAGLAVVCWGLVSPRGLATSMERRVPAAGAVVDIRGPALDVVRNTAFTAGAVVIVAVVKCVAARVVAIVVINYGVTAPADAPVVPAPAVAAVEADTEAYSSPVKSRAAPPDSGIRIPTRPGHDGISVNQPGIVSGDVHHVGLCGLNDDIRSLRLDGLLWRVLQIAGLLSFLAHHLNRVHHTLFLVVISVTE